jgi:transcriptional regulator with XRE-family HTH domain
MDNFTTHQIIENNEIIAKEIKRARQAKKISLVDASKHLKIKQAYLEALERGDFEALPNGVYRVNFLREYGAFLGLSANDLVKLFNEENTPELPKDLFVKKATHVHYFITIPKLAKNLFIFSASLVCFVYLAFYLNAIISPPTLIVENPAIDIITNEKEILISGKTDPEAEITINDKMVLADSQGDFSKKIYLKSGLNTIVIAAQKKYSRRNEAIKKILVNEG